MNNYILSVLCICLTVSCSLNREKPNKQHPASNIKSDSLDVYKALGIKSDDLKKKTGVYTLENGGNSFIARIWLLDHAQRSIDIQYYSFAKDVTGRIACDRIVQAADKGVKIRILIDDAASRMRSYEIRLLDSHENIEIRVYNAGLMLGRLDRRIWNLAKNSNRLLRRMHNKTMTFDDEVCITGGRNIADEYFDYDDKYNFRDRDVMMMGKAVDDVKISFDQFWNDKLTVRYSELSGRSAKKQMNDRARLNRLHEDAEKEFSAEMRSKLKQFPEELKAAQRSGELVWVSQISFVSDIPGKNEEKEKREGGVCTDSLISLFKSAKSTIDIQSPYFITTEQGKQLITETINRGVRIRLLTNSLASIDNPEAFSGYQKDREEILKAGIQVYEFKPDPQVRFKLMIPEVQAGLNYKPVYGMHSKTIIIDGITSVIGSYNFDPRSANLNTECIVIIRSEKVAKNLSKYVEEEFLPENSWKTTLEKNSDHKASLKKRIKAGSRKIIPKKLL
ncbi:MAG: phospholipase family protein [Bacteroidetes bacterium]|jgi:phosphatidylserine/phosphatidylglycerophosphate/cardiolipin synthase-like enzyme|nr:phospholipase family protein [Bacteroidota bacterium]